MKFKIECKELQKVLSKIIGVVPTKASIPIIENVLLSVKDHDLIITATDINISMQVKIKIIPTEEGELAVNGKRLFETLKALPEITLDISDFKNKLRIKTMNGEYHINSESGQDFPLMPEVKAIQSIHIKGDKLTSWIENTTYAVSKDDLPPSMTGILLNYKQDDFRIASTDGHRLVRIIDKEIFNLSEKSEIIVPFKAMDIALKSIGQYIIEISFNKKLIKFDFGDCILISKLIDEPYPNIEAVIPNEFMHKAEVSKSEMLGSVRRVGLYASSTTHQVKIKFNKDEMIISSEDFEMGGEAKESISCDYNQEDAEAGFNAIFVIDLLDKLQYENIKIEFNSPLQAFKFSPLIPDSVQDITAIVMPVRLNS